jgi:DNA-binding NtrC family response regulator
VKSAGGVSGGTLGIDPSLLGPVAVIGTAPVLLVEPNPRVAAILVQAVGGRLLVERHETFVTARDRLFATPFSLVVTNLRLREFNGLHLVHLVTARANPPRCIVYTDTPDALLARDIKRSGAFYELAERLPTTLPAYVQTVLPPADRRDTILDRRMGFRGGRRVADQPSTYWSAWRATLYAS